MCVWSQLYIPGIIERRQRLIPRRILKIGDQVLLQAAKNNKLDWNLG
jgi:hypothetical protein